MFSPSREAKILEHRPSFSSSELPAGATADSLRVEVEGLELQDVGVSELSPRLARVVHFADELKAFMEGNARWVVDGSNY